jgi:hypothetical protein
LPMPGPSFEDILRLFLVKDDLILGSVSQSY